VSRRSFPGRVFSKYQNFYVSQLLKPDISSVNAPVLKRMLTKSLSSEAFRTAKPFILAHAGTADPFGFPENTYIIGCIP
jgi:hypothetical protein